MKKNIILITSIITLLCSPQIIYAQTAAISAHVNRILIQEGAYGNCMALLDKKIASQANRPNSCPGSWITFSCDGTYNSKDIAYRKLDIAQKSEVTGHRIFAVIDDTKKHNGHCFAVRIDSFNNR